MITLEDLEGQIEAMVFAETWRTLFAEYPDAVKAEQIVFLRGKVDKKRETPSLIVNDLIPIEDAVARLTRGIKIEIDSSPDGNELLAQLKPIFTRHKGNCDTFVQVPAGGNEEGDDPAGPLLVCAANARAEAGAGKRTQWKRPRRTGRRRHQANPPAAATTVVSELKKSTMDRKSRQPQRLQLQSPKSRLRWTRWIWPTLWSCEAAIEGYSFAPTARRSVILSMVLVRVLKYT